MGSIPSPSRPLEFTPVIWAALLLVCLLWVKQLTRDEEEVGSLDYLESGDLLIVKSTNQLHRFPRLGIEVDVSDGWSYLGVRNDDRATLPTFMHSSTQSILRLQPFLLQSWPIEGIPLENETYGDTVVEWAELDDRRIGRLENGPLVLMVTAITHRPKAELNDRIRSFCRRIRLIEAKNVASRASNSAHSR